MRGNVRLAVAILNPTRLIPRDRGAKPPAPVPNAGCGTEFAEKRCANCGDTKPLEGFPVRGVCDRP